MASALKNAFCGCEPLRQVCLIFLYFNLVMYASGMIYHGLISILGPSLHHYAIYSNPVIDLILEVIGCVIVFAAIIQIHKKEPPQCRLTICAVIVFLLAVIVNILIAIITNTDFESYGRMVLAKALYVLFIAIEVYSALACYCYMEEWKRPAQLNTNSAD